MKAIRKYAEFVGYVIYHSDRIAEWRCPNSDCGLSVAEDYVCCPHCGQRLKFKEPEPVHAGMIKIPLCEKVREWSRG